MLALQPLSSDWALRNRACLAVVIGALLTACGGGSGSSPDAIPVGLANDSATVAWNAPATIDVLANDSSTGLTLQAASDPDHGQTSIVGGKVLYVPVAGYFGTDTFTYTAQAANGARATATVDLTIEASFQVQGVVSDGPIANAAVTVSVGGVDFAGSADAQGVYNIAVRSADSAAFVNVAASGTGAQSHIKLVSRLGTIADLAARVPASNVPSQVELHTTQVSHVSTALAVLAQQANGGTAPTSQAAWESALDAVPIEPMLDMAAAIKRVVDDGAALPAGAADTLALVSTPAALASFLDSQVAADGAAFRATRQTVIDQAPAARVVTLAPSGPLTLVFFSGRGAAVSAGVLAVTLSSDGTASLVSDLGAGPAHWTVVDGEIRVVHDNPLHTVAYANDAFGSMLSLATTGFSFRVISGSVSRGLVQQVTNLRQTFIDGPKAGTTEAVSRADLPATLVRVIDVANRLPLSATEFGGGSRLAGIAVTTPLARVRPFAFTLLVASLTDFTQQVLSFDGSANARLDDGSLQAWSVADNWLMAGGRQFARLRVDAATGEERWLAFDSPVGQATKAMEMPVARFGAATPFDPADLAREWRSAEFAASVGSDLRFKLFADGSEQQLSKNDGVTSTFSLNWTLDAGTRLMHRRTLNSGALRERTWVLLARTETQLWVLESVLDTTSGGVPFASLTPRLSRYTDEGPATP